VPGAILRCTDQPVQRGADGAPASERGRAERPVLRGDRGQSSWRRIRPYRWFDARVAKAPPGGSVLGTASGLCYRCR